MKIVNSEIFMRGDFSFSENEALNGGAIYVEKSTVYFSPKSKTMQIEFKNNRAVYGGDVYAEDSSLIFDAKNFSIDLSNGMRMRGGKIEKTGGRDLIFRGENSVLESDLIIKEGAAIFTSFGSTVANITIESSGTLSLAGGAFNKLFVATVFSSGTLIFDLNFSALSAFGDAICGGSVSIASGSVLKINEINRDTWIYGSSTKIIWTNANSLSLNINDILYDGSIYKLIKTDNSLWIKYYGQLPNLRKLNLTHNQDEAYSSLQYYRDVLESDKIKSAKERESFQKYAVEMNEIIADVFSTSDTDRIKQSLDVLSGSFLAQTIVEVSMDSPHKMLYSGLNPFSLADLPQRGDDLRSLKFRALWVDVGVKAAQRNDEKNLLGVFEKASAQAALGFNFIESTDLIAGMFGRTAITQIKQDENKAEIQSYEGGFYGGIFSRFFDHKFFAAFGYHNAFTKRKIDLGRGYNPQAAFDLYTLRIGGENSLIISEYIHLYAGVLFSQVYNDELQETDGGPVGLKVEQSRYNRFDGYGGLRIGPRNFYFSIEAGYLIYGNLEQARFGMFMGGFNHRMDIEGSNADPLYFSANVGWDKKLSDDFTLQTMGGVSSDKDEQSKSAALNVRLKYLFPTAKSEKAYRDILFKNFKTIEEFNRPRKDILLDKNTGWGKGNPAVNPDKKGEDKMQENSHSKNRMLVQVLTEDAEGKLKWRNFITMDMKIFKPGSSEIGEKVSKIISEEMGKLDEKNLKVSRVRIGRYGHSLEDEEMKLAQARAENIYEAMFLYKENLEKAERQKLAEEEAKKLSEDKKKKEQERLREAKARRENSIVSYKIKAASFEVGHARLSREALENLDDLAFEIKRTKYKTITVEGHTDSTGSRERNLFLSEERAMAVYMELLKRGIPAEKLKIAAFGPDMPAGDNATAEGRLSNRRVEIFVE
jgi:predicted outer membrane repeat protein